MKKKRIIIVISALVLVFALMAMGTLAYLTNSANEGAGVVNTFTAAGGGKLIEDPDPEDDDLNETFTLYEHALTKDDKGVYTLSEDIAEGGNAYEVLPGVDLPKDPQIDINKKTSAPAFLFVEVVDGITTEDGLLSFALTTEWVLLDGITGAQGGDVYVYVQDGTADSDADDATIIDDKTWENGKITGLSILEGDKITVADGDSIEIDEDAHLDFYAYLAQASAGEDAAEVYTVCFLPAETTAAESTSAGSTPEESTPAESEPVKE